MNTRDLPAGARMFDQAGPGSVMPAEPNNTVYAFIQRIERHELKHHHPHIYARARKMAQALETSYQSDDKLRWKIRAQLPQDFSATLVPAAERAIVLSGAALRDELNRIFIAELNQAVEQERARVGK